VGVDGRGRAGTGTGTGRERNGTRERSTETDGARRARGVTMKPVVGRVVLRVEAKVRRDADATLVIFWFAPGKGPGSFNSPLPGWIVRKKRDERNGTEWNGMEWNGMEWKTECAVMTNAWTVSTVSTRNGCRFARWMRERRRTEPSEGTRRLTRRRENAGRDEETRKPRRDGVEFRGWIDVVRGLRPFTGTGV